MYAKILKDTIHNNTYLKFIIIAYAILQIVL